MRIPTHAYVGYNADGTPILLAVDDGSQWTADEVATVLEDGGHVERMTLEDARKVKLYEKPDGVTP